MKCYDFNKTRLHSHMYNHMSIIEITQKKKVKKRNMQEKKVRISLIKKNKNNRTFGNCYQARKNKI